MEGVALIIALIAAVVAIGAVAFALRTERRIGESSPASPRTSGLERQVAHLSQRLAGVQADVDALRAGGTAEPRVVASPLPRDTAAVSRIGLIRFDAFDDTGGAQSFSLALVDDDGDGIVLTSLHSRQTTRIYIKAIRRGVADAPLSAEETRALQDAGITPTV